jgi:signal transduction histidine kinase
MLRSLETLPRGRLRIVLSALLILAFCVPALAAGFGFYQFTRVSLTEEVESGLALLAQFKTSQVQDWIDGRVHDLGAIARLTAVRAGVARVVRGDSGAMDSLWAALERERSSAYEDRYLSFSVFSADQSRFAPVSPVREVDQLAFAAALGGSPAVSVARERSGDGEPLLEIYAPLSDLSGSQGAVMIARLSPEPVFSAITTGRPGSSEQVHIVDSAGRILNPVSPEVDSFPLRQTGADAVRQPSGAHIVYLDERGVEVVGVQRKIAGVNWRLVIERDRDEAFRRLIHLKEVLWVVLGAIFVLGSAGAVAAANLAVARLDRREQELHTTHQQLITADRLASVGMMAASVAHEINNPLTTIKVLIHSLREHLSDEDTRRNDLGIILAEIDKIKAIVLRFLQFARPRDPEFASVDLSDTLTRVVALIGPQAQGKGLAMTESYQENSGPVWADAAQIGQVFLNILLNAVDATPAGGGIRVSMAPGEENQVAVRIWNSGPGLPPELEERIFEPFFSTKPTGTGLGLSIARTIVGKHRGTITAKGHGDGGTSFIITLNNSQQETAHASRPDR